MIFFVFVAIMHACMSFSLFLSYSIYLVAELQLRSVAYEICGQEGRMNQLRKKGREGTRFGLI